MSARHDLLADPQMTGNAGVQQQGLDSAAAAYLRQSRRQWVAKPFDHPCGEERIRR